MPGKSRPLAGRPPPCYTAPVSETKPAARPESRVFRVIVVLAGLYVLAYVVCSLPILRDMFEKARARQEAR